MGTTATTRSDDRGATTFVRSWVLSGLRRPVIDCAVGLAFLVAAVWLTHGLWPDPATRQLALNPADQILIEWFLAVDTRVLVGEHGLVTDRLNVPSGVNLLANASSLTLGLLLAPITLTLGAPVSFAVLTAGNLAGTAIAWYLLFARTLHTHRAAAAVGGGFCGFAPAMVSQSNSHWHIAAQWLVPAIVWSVIRLVRAAEASATGTGAAGTSDRRIVTSGLWLAALVVVQYFLGAEILYLTAVTLALLAIAYALLRPRWARQILPGFATGLMVATGVAMVLLAYPLWVQLAGPGGVTSGPFTTGYFSADLASWTVYSPLTVAGSDTAAVLATGPSEYNTFLGWPLLVVAAGCAVLLRDRPIVLAAATAAVVMAVLSLGPELVVNRTRTGLTLPFTVLLDRPVIDGALPQRYALAVVPLLGTILVLTLDRMRVAPGRLRLVGPVAVGIALLPLLPAPLPTDHRAPVPAFISEGHWRGCRVMVPVPVPHPSAMEPMRWAAATNAEFALPEGFFIGPYGQDGGASVGAPRRPTSLLLAGVADTGEIPPIGESHRRQAARDLAAWGADCVVLGPGQPYEPALRSVLEAMLGPGERVADAWVWRDPLARR
jgi:hypothetical protein